MASRGFARQRGAGVSAGFVPDAKEMMLFPRTKGPVPQGRIQWWVDVWQRVLAAAGRGSRGCSPRVSEQGMQLTPWAQSLC